MGRTVSEKISRLPAQRRKRIANRARDLIAEELTLRELRKARDLTQADIARKLDIGQDSISRFEKQTDMMISTLQRYVEAADGKLSLLVEFPNRKPVRIVNFGDILEDRAQPAEGSDLRDVGVAGSNPVTPTKY